MKSSWSRFLEPLDPRSWNNDVRRYENEQQRLVDHINSHGHVASQLGYLVAFDEPPLFGAPVGPLEATEFKTWSITSSTTASVEETGSISVTRGRDLAAKAVGGLLIPGGVFMFGNAKDRVHDMREMYLIIEDDDWSYTHPLAATYGFEARHLSQEINLIARKLRPDKNVETRLDTLERLSQLHKSGALTNAEFKEQKALILKSEAVDES